jgi:uncharacterized protein (TIGR02466 family)
MMQPVTAIGPKPVLAKPLSELEKALTAEQELALLRTAYQRLPSSEMRQRLTILLMLEEAFSEVIELLTACETLNFREEFVLAQAYLSLENPAADALSHAAAGRAFALATSNLESAGALATRGKCEARLGKLKIAQATLTEALTLDPLNRDACKRLTALELAKNNPEAVLKFTEKLSALGANHARLFAAQSLAHAQAGDIASAKVIEGFDVFHIAEQLTPPDGWDSIEAFNEALALELLAHPGIRYERYGSASALTWRIENPARSDTPLYKALLAQIIKVLEKQVAAALETRNHAWAAAAPHQSYVRNWCVITESEGFESWHVHQFGWLSGVYYVRIPDSIANGDSKDGCLAFGLPDDLAGTQAAVAFGEHLVRPQEGLLMTFPSQCYHRTYPHGTGEKRICVAFDLRPE